MKKLDKNAVIAAIIVVAAISLVSAYIVKLNSVRNNELAKVEIKNYKGTDLSSINDLRENSIKGPQYVDIAKYRLKIDGQVAEPVELTYKEILKGTKYKKVVKLYCVEGWDVTVLWEGFLMTDILDKAGVLPSARTVIFYSADGFLTSLPLRTIVERQMILAYKMNGVILPAERGYPFQLVAEDKLGYKWAKWVTHIELSDNVHFRGYWESRGYSDEASVN